MFTQPVKDLSQNIGMHLTQGPIDRDVPVVPVRSEAYQAVGSQQAAETGAIGAAGRQAIGLIYDDAGQEPLAGIEST